MLKGYSGEVNLYVTAEFALNAKGLHIIIEQIGRSRGVLMMEVIMKVDNTREFGQWTIHCSYYFEDSECGNLRLWAWASCKNCGQILGGRHQKELAYKTVWFPEDGFEKFYTDPDWRWDVSPEDYYDELFKLAEKRLIRAENDEFYCGHCGAKMKEGDKDGSD